MSLTDAAQGAIVQRLRTDAALTALVGGRVYDDVPDGAEHPYISLGPEDWRPTGVDCIPGEDGVIQIDIWSDAPGRVECKEITDRVAALLDGAEFALAAPFALVSAQVLMKRYLQDPQSLTRHGVVQLEVMIEVNP